MKIIMTILLMPLMFIYDRFFHLDIWELREREREFPDLYPPNEKLGRVIEPETKRRRSLGVGDHVYLGPQYLETWEVMEIKQPYDEHDNMLEPVVVLKLLIGEAWPLYRTKDKGKLQEMPLFELMKHLQHPHNIEQGTTAK